MRLTLLLVLLSIPGFAQYIVFEEIDAKKVTPWVSKQIASYEGVYRFGDSEGESTLVLIVTKDRISGQIRSGYFTDDGKDWMWKFENVKDIRIDGNRFSSSLTNGEFVNFDDAGKKLPGLKVFKPWSGLGDTGEWEVGLRKGSSSEYFSGKFTQASRRPLEVDELSKLSKSDLRIMRNEIFARYGLKFKVGGEMAVYFANQEWYHGQYDNVEHFLTDLEKENVKLIISAENK